MAQQDAFKNSFLGSGSTFTLESASHDARGGEPPNPGHHERADERRKRLRQEIGNLTDWTRKNEKIREQFPRPLRAPQGRGGEHIVSLDPLSGRFLKATRPEAQLGFGIALGDYIRGATLSEYLDRLALQNRLFSDDISLECVVPHSGRGISIVTSQPAIKGRAASPEEIDALMAAMYFERFAAGIYYEAQQGLLLYDLHPRNVLVDTTEVPQVIDPVVQRVTPDFANFIRNSPFLVDRVY